MIGSRHNELLHKLDAFTRKYYLNEILRGSIFTAVYILVLFLSISITEYYLYLPSLHRKLLFYGFLLSTAVVFGKFVLLPVLHYYKLGKIISHEKAAEIIGKHFSEVKDKLLNVLQLQSMASRQEFDLLQASIQQKISELRPFNFSLAIDLSQNRKYLKFLFPPALVLLFIVIAAPNVITESTKRLYFNNREFEKQAPFTFLLMNKELKALQNQAFTLQVKVEGKALPSEVFLETDKQTYKLKRKSSNEFYYEFNSLQQSFAFRLQANGFRSKTYALQVMTKPGIAALEVRCDYPSYTGRPDETLKGAGDLNVPVGTKLTWLFKTSHASAVKIKWGDNIFNLPGSDNDQLIFSQTAKESLRYIVFVADNQTGIVDSVAYTLHVIPDLYPTLSVVEKRDSVNIDYFYYVGEAGDDYGLRNLIFHYFIECEDSLQNPNVKQVMNVPIVSGSIQSRFTHFWNIREIGLKPSDKITYYFEVWDNDGVNGSKSTRSEVRQFKMPSLREMEKQIDEQNKELKQELAASIKQAKDLKEKLKNAQDKILEKKNLNWEDKKNLSDLAYKQKQLQQQLKEIKDKLNETLKKQDDIKPVSEQIKEKQEKLQELFNKVLDEEIKKLYEKLEKMLEELNKKDALEKMSEMEMTNEKLEKELDRMLELFKKLEFSKKLEETANKLEQLAKKEEELANKTSQLNNSSPDKQPEKNNKSTQPDVTARQQQLLDEQKKLQNQLKEAQQDLNDLKKLNEETKSEQDMNEAEKNVETAEKQMDDAQEQLLQNQNSKAAQNQKSAANNLKNAAQKMKDMKNKMEQDGLAEDYQSLRQLLKNIMQLSFEQEKLIEELKNININNPKYVQLMKSQQKIRENSKMVEDSLYALAKRQVSIESFVTKEMNQVNRYLAKAIENLEDRYVSNAMSDQQFVMTGYNNLALMLSESLQELQMQMSDSQSDQQQDGKPKAACKKPGKNSKGIPNLSQMQKQLNDKISQLSEMIKREGAGQQGNREFQKELSKQFSELAAKQAELRKALEKLNQEQNKDGKNSLGNLGEAIEKMNQTETQLVNKQLTVEMLKRQQEIFTRLLEAENAMRQRDEDPQRESRTGQEMNRKMPPSLEEYIKQQQQQADFYKTTPPALKPFYKQLSDQYFRNLSQ
jgi:hypothetical protein